MLVVVDAKDERAAAFYKRFDYEPLIVSDAESGKWPQRYYVKMSTLRASYGLPANASGAERRGGQKPVT